MNQLDDFEKQLRDQLKGHVTPEPLMWSRLSDALGKAKPWYAKSVFKYALTAITSLGIGAYSSYLFFNAQDAKPQKDLASQIHPKPIARPQVKMPEQSTHLGLIQQSTTAPMSASAPIWLASDSTSVATEYVVATPAFDSNETNNQALLLACLQGLKPSKIDKKTAVLRVNQEAIPGAKRLGISLASGSVRKNAPSVNYNLGPLADYQQEQTMKASPLLQLQFALLGNWHFNVGVQQIKESATEHFHQTKVYSFDDKEHFLFPYLYGYRQVSDEELHGGPWPFGPNPPGGPTTSYVLANYTSKIQTNTLYVPLTMSYHKQFGLFEAQLHAGVGLHFGFNNVHTLVLPGYLPSSILIDEPFLRFRTSLQTQLRLSYLANKHLAVFIEPQFKTAFQQNNFPNSKAYRPQSGGVYAGISWRF